MTDVTLDDLTRCFGGLIPSVIATCSAGGVPNVTYLSRAHPVDRERIAISNQFLSKSSRNLAERPFASVLVMDPLTHDEYRLTGVYERTERRGPVFDRLRNDLSMIAALTGMQDVFQLAAADIYRVTDIELLDNVGGTDVEVLPTPQTAGHAALGELCGRLSRCGDLDSLVRMTVEGLGELLGYRHAQLLLVDEDRARLFTIASSGYAVDGIGAEIAMGDGVVGRAAERCEPVIVGNVGQMTKYSQSVRISFERSGEIRPGREIAMPTLEHTGSQLAIPALALGELVGVILVEDEERERFSNNDAVVVSIVATAAAGSIEMLRSEARNAGAVSVEPARGPVPDALGATVLVRHFVVDGSTFLDGDYLIKGVAGKLLWSLLGHFEREGRTEFTNREIRLDPTLELPDFRDNFESRLILLKRRLDERAARLRIERTARGRFRLVVHATPRLELMAAEVST